MLILHVLFDHSKRSLATRFPWHGSCCNRREGDPSKQGGVINAALSNGKLQGFDVRIVPPRDSSFGVKNV